jgi:hypothetical protein
MTTFVITVIIENLVGDFPRAAYYESSFGAA